MLNLVKKFVKEEEGAAMVEYAILIGIIAVAAIVAIGTIGLWVTGRFETLANNLP